MSILNPRDILDNRTNWRSPKSAYGEAAQEEVVHFYNLYSPEDNVLERKLSHVLQIYPFLKGVWHLDKTDIRRYQILHCLEIIQM
jgi:hypothetical protein